MSESNIKTVSVTKQIIADWYTPMLDFNAAVVQAHKTTLAVLKHAQESQDIEAAHSDADEALCAFLIQLGYRDVVDEYEKVSKWYA